MTPKYKSILPWDVKPRYLLMFALVFLLALVTMEEFIPGWDDNLITDIMAVVQTFVVAAVAFILGQT